MDFNKTHIEQQFTRRLGHQLLLIDKITMNNLSLGLPLMITKFINTTWAEKAQYSCQNLLGVDYNRGEEIVSQVQNNRGEEIVSQVKFKK